MARKPASRRQPEVAWVIYRTTSLRGRSRHSAIRYIAIEFAAISRPIARVGAGTGISGQATILLHASGRIWALVITSPRVGGTGHIGGVFFQKETGTRYAFVPY